jgi:hypothetical protein
MFVLRAEIVTIFELKLVKFYQSQKFYPQCKPCSQKQGNICTISDMSRRALSDTKHETTAAGVLYTISDETHYSVL